MRQMEWWAVVWISVLVALALGLVTYELSHAGEFYVEASGGVTNFIRTIDDGTWIQEGLPHQVHSQTFAWRTGAGYRISPEWSIQAHYLNFGAVQIETLAVSDDHYDPQAHRCLTDCANAAPFHTRDFMQGGELSVSRHIEIGPVSPFLRVGGAALYHRLIATFGGQSIAGQDGHAFRGWIPTALVGGGICYGWLCAETTYYYGFGGGTDWSAGLPIAKQSMMSLLTIQIPFGSVGMP